MLADRLKKLRKQRGLSAYALSLKAGLGSDHVGKIERGERVRVEWPTVLKLAEALGVSVGELSDE